MSPAQREDTKHPSRKQKDRVRTCSAVGAYGEQTDSSAHPRELAQLRQFQNVAQFVTVRCKLPEHFLFTRERIDTLVSPNA